MQPDRFRPLAADGPFASVYFDDSHDTEDAGAQLHVRWKGIASELEGQGADPDLTSAVQRAARRASAGGGHHRSARVARRLRHPQWYRCHGHPGIGPRRHSPVMHSG